MSQQPSPPAGSERRPRVGDAAHIIPDQTLVAYGDACAALTPRIKQALTSVTSGAVVEVRTDDPSARAGVPAWARVTGNPLLDVVEDGDQLTRFFIRKK